MRSPLRVPEALAAGLERLTSVLTPAMIDGVGEAVRDKVSLRDLKDALKASGASEVDDLAETLLALAVNDHHFAERHPSGSIGTTGEGRSFLDQLSDQLSTLWNDETLGRWKALVPSLQILVDEPMQALEKAIRLQYAHTNILVEAQLVTDIRPVLNGNGDAILAGIICHTLRLEYRSDGRTKHLFVALDSRDLERLRESCDRELKKEKVLRTHLEDPKPIHVKVPGSSDDI